MGRAWGVSGAESRFEITPSGVPKEVLSDRSTLMDVTFRVEEVLKGRVANKVLQLKLKVYTAPAPDPSAKAQCERCADGQALVPDAPVLFEQLNSLERALEEGKLSRDEYKAKLTKTRAKILSASSYLYQDFVLVEVAPSSVESHYRVATVADLSRVRGALAANARTGRKR
jgi:hypothetical protein